MSARATTSPHFRALDASEIEAVLARNHVGRVAYSFHDRVDIEPVHFVYERGWLYGRTSPGTKLATIQHNRWVAFEVDEVAGPFDWQSVVVHGALYLLAPDDEVWGHALELLRTVIPETLGAGDPAPFRTVLFRIAVQESTGREASSTGRRTSRGTPQGESSPSRRASLT